MIWLKDSLVIPNPRAYQMYVSVVDSSHPLTNYTIKNRKSDIELVVNEESRINLPLGNYNIDELKLYINDRLPPRFLVSYSENKTKLKLSTSQPYTNL